MKRTPTIKSLRTGQTIYYAALVPAARQMVYRLRAVTVLSDKSELTPTYLIADGYPRWFMRESLASGGGPRGMSYSRRKTLAWIKSRESFA